MSNDWQNLLTDYTNNVLHHIFKDVDANSLRDYSYGAAGGKFSLEPYINSILNSAHQFKPRGKNFVHFTSLKALHSILNEMSLRMYNLNNMNDPEEFQMIARDFGYNEYQVNDFKESTYLLSLLPSQVLKTTKALTLWRLYGSGGNGCLIELEIEEKLSSIKLVKVAYGKPDYKNFFIDNKNFEERNNIDVDLKGLIKISACIHKDAGYAIENEVRLLHTEGAPNETLTHRDDHPYKYDFNSRNKIVSYFKLDLYNEDIGYPFIKIKRIQLGFKFNEDDLKNIKEHLGLIFYSMSKKLGIEIETPIIEISPLKGKFI